MFLYKSSGDSLSLRVVHIFERRDLLHIVSLTKPYAQFGSNAAVVLLI